MAPDDIRTMVRHGLARKIDSDEVPLASVDLFPHAEESKRRRRRIGHTRAINAALGKDTLQRVSLPSRRAQLVQSLAGNWSISLDFSAFFDAFQLSKEVQMLHCFRSEGEIFCLTRLPMGQRQSVEVAQGATSLLLAFPTPGCVTQSYIDNVRFVGTRKAVVAAACTFVKRCNSANLRINDIDQRSSDLATILNGLAKQEDAWLGLVHDLKHKRVRVGEKSISKLAAVVKELRGTTPAYTVAAFFGLLLFGSSVLRCNVAAHFPTMKFLRRFSKDLAEAPQRWKQVVTIPPGALDDMLRWASEVLANVPVQIKPNDAPTLIICVDASAWGWGAICFNVAEGSFHSASVAWTAEERISIGTDDSVYAEPEAAYRALCRFVNPVKAQVEGTVISVLTDSVCTVAAINTGYSPSFAVNRIANRIHQAFGHLAILATHIPGVNNPSDGLSRGQVAEVQAATGLLDSLRQLAGCATQRPPNVNL